MFLALSAQETLILYLLSADAITLPGVSDPPKNLMARTMATTITAMAMNAKNHAKP